MDFLINKRFQTRNHILSIAINPNYRRKNLATMLINNLKKDNNDITLYVQCINKIAINLYIKNGFKCSKKLPNYYDSLNNKEAYLMIYSIDK